MGRDGGDGERWGRGGGVRPARCGQHAVGTCSAMLMFVDQPAVAIDLIHTFVAADGASPAVKPACETDGRRASYAQTASGTCWTSCATSGGISGAVGERRRWGGAMSKGMMGAADVAAQGLMDPRGGSRALSATPGTYPRCAVSPGQSFSRSQHYGQY